MDSSIETTSREDLIAMAKAQGLHVEGGVDRKDVIDLLRASHAADSEPSPPPTSATATGAAATTTSAGAPETGDEDEEVAAASADMLRSIVGVKGFASESDSISPLRRGMPVSLSWQHASVPQAPQLSDILAARVMARSRVDTSSSVAVEVGTDAGSVAGCGGGFGGGEGTFDNDAEQEAELDAEEASSGTTSAGAAIGGRDAGEHHTAPSADEKGEAVDTFKGITQVSSSKAVQFLEATEWNVGAAINLFMESGGDSVEAPTSRNRDRRTRGSGAESDREDYRASSVLPLAQDPAGGYEWGTAGGHDQDNGGMSDDEEIDVDPDVINLGSISALPGRVVSGLERASARGHAGSTDSHSPPPGGAEGARTSGSGRDRDDRYPGGFSEDGVRAPIPNRRDRLIGGAGDHAIGGAGAILGDLIRGSLGRAGAAPAEEDDTDWIFSIPEGLSFPSDFVETRQLCKEQKKWLMVNIQDHEEFSSHRMNKDVWSNETILTLLRGNFVFWQRNKTLSQARYYIDKYYLDGQVLPHTAILDPRTGTQLLKVVGNVEAQVLSMAIVEFLESNSIDQVKAPKLKTIGLSKMRSRHGDNPGKDGQVSNKTSSESSVGTYGRAAGGESFGKDLAYESFGSEDYDYEDDPDGDDVGQGASLDGDDTNSRTSTAVGSNKNASPPHSNSSPHSTASFVGGVGGNAAAKAIVTEAPEIVGPWGKGSPEDDLGLAMAMEASLKGADGDGVMPKGLKDEEVPPEPEAGEGVTQVRFRLPSAGGTIARRFWMKDKVALLYQYVRSTVEEASTRPFDLLSGHPPSSLGDRKTFTVEDAQLRNSVIMVRWS